jgi:hypothetical protein
VIRLSTWRRGCGLRHHSGPAIRHLHAGGTPGNIRTSWRARPRISWTQKTRPREGQQCVADDQKEIVFSGTVSPCVDGANVVLGISAVQLQSDGTFAKVRHVKPTQYRRASSACSSSVGRPSCGKAT